jgi:hypothetical protein
MDRSLVELGIAGKVLVLVDLQDIKQEKLVVGDGRFIGGHVRNPLEEILRKLWLARVKKATHVTPL